MNVILKMPLFCVYWVTWYTESRLALYFSHADTFRYITIATFIILASLTAVVWAIGKLPVVESPTTLKRQYLTSKIFETRDLAIEGIPLLRSRVQLGFAMIRQKKAER